MEINYGRTLSGRSLFLFFLIFFTSTGCIGASCRTTARVVVIFERWDAARCSRAGGARWLLTCLLCKALPLGLPSRGRPIRFITWPRWVLMNILIIPLNGSAYWGVFTAAPLQINMEGCGGKERRRWEEDRRTLMTSRTLGGLLCMFPLVEIKSEPIFPLAVLMTCLWAVYIASWLNGGNTRVLLCNFGNK